ncbi:MAG: selenium cofactor biosynthesis protein YqeC [Andreesenia angusta]|nr:selenium cofactor biosynthesis protein YqeC [Andreesenia angusta]
MNLYRYFGLDLNKRQVVSIVGGGGKTTTLYRLAEELKGLGKKVLVTTSTCMMVPQDDQYDNFLTLRDLRKDEEILKSVAKDGSITVIMGEITRKDKVKGLEEETIDYIANEDIFDYILIEADGAKRRPIKAPRDGEPLIPNCTDIVIGIIGLDAYGKDIDEDTIHRLEIFKDILEINDREEFLDVDIIADLVVHPKGLFKNSEDKERYLLLNKADTEELLEVGRRIKEEIPESLGIKDIYITSFKNNTIE